MLDAAEECEPISCQKWGGSFLKSGLPLDHLTLLALKSIGWTCEIHYGYRRLNREGERKWFEHDVVAYSPEPETRELELLVECKWHDESRFWFYQLCETEDHLARWTSTLIHRCFTLRLTRSSRRPMLRSSFRPPPSVSGVSPSHVTAPVNAVEEATNQLGFGFVPFCLEGFYGLPSLCSPSSLRVRASFGFVRTSVTSTRFARPGRHRKWTTRAVGCGTTTRRTGISWAITWPRSRRTRSAIAMRSGSPWLSGSLSFGRSRIGRRDHHWCPRWRGWRILPAVLLPAKGLFRGSAHSADLEGTKKASRQGEWQMRTWWGTPPIFLDIKGE